MHEAFKGMESQLSMCALRSPLSFVSQSNGIPIESSSNGYDDKSFMFGEFIDIFCYRRRFMLNILFDFEQFCD
jgi:hypothetical protein